MKWVNTSVSKFFFLEELLDLVLEVILKNGRPSNLKSSYFFILIIYIRFGSKVKCFKPMIPKFDKSSIYKILWFRL